MFIDRFSEIRIAIDYFLLFIAKICRLYSGLVQTISFFITHCSCHYCSLQKIKHLLWSDIILAFLTCISYSIKTTELYNITVLKICAVFIQWSLLRRDKSTGIIQFVTRETTDRTSHNIWHCCIIFFIRVCDVETNSIYRSRRLLHVDIAVRGQDRMPRKDTTCGYCCDIAGL